MRAMVLLCVTLVYACLVPHQRRYRSAAFIGTIHYDVLNKGKHIELVATSDGERFRQDVAAPR